MTAILQTKKKIVSKLHEQFLFSSVLDISYEFVQHELFFLETTIFWIQKSHKTNIFLWGSGESKPRWFSLYKVKKLWSNRLGSYSHFTLWWESWGLRCRPHSMGNCCIFILLKTKEKIKQKGFWHFKLFFKNKHTKNNQQEWDSFHIIQKILWLKRCLIIIAIKGT